MEQLLTVKQLAEALQINEQTVQRFIREGKLKAFRVGREYRIKKSKLNEYLTELSTEKLAK